MKYTDATRLKRFHVHLREDPLGDFCTVFACWAEDEEHAIEQADDAYPENTGCEAEEEKK
jgi:1,2-phenylacetyl-CoA epoxidase PaaB subunit